MMPLLSFTLLAGGVGQFHDLLTCLVKFDENISLEASSNSLRISSLNSSKSAHACFILNANLFFVKYRFQAEESVSSSIAEPTWGCTLQNRALLSIFKKRYVDPKEKDVALERCEFELQSRADETKCRLVVRMMCQHGVVRTYKLTYEPANVLRANFDGAASPNQWTTSARTLRDIVEYFGAKTDQLDWSFEKGKVHFTSYTEKITDGRDIFKQAMHTSVAIERKDFHDFHVQEGLHIGIMVRDFRGIVSHADGLGANVTAKYSRGNRPMQITYDRDGILCEFTLMTREKSVSMSSASSTRTGTPVRDLSVVPVQRPAQQTNLRTTDQDLTPTPLGTMRPPSTATASLGNGARPQAPNQSMSTTKKNQKPSRDGSPRAPSASLDQHSLFFPAGEDEHFWDEHENDGAEQEDFVTWDASGRGGAGGRIRDNEPATAVQAQRPSNEAATKMQGIPPTQRLSQVRGLFD